MILDSVSHISTYKDLDPLLYKGLELLTTDLMEQPVGRYELEGDELFYMLQAYETKPDNPLAEAHEKYIDIQCVLSGAEKIGVAPLASMEQAEAHPDKDFSLYKGQMDYITLTPGRFAVLWPQDAHAPGIAVDQPAACRKCVVKVRVK